MQPESSFMHISIIEQYGWHYLQQGDVEIWGKGYGQALDLPKMVRWLSTATASTLQEELKDYLCDLDGHFALAARGADWAFAAVDRVRSIPVAYAEGPDGWILDDQAWRLKSHLGLHDVDADAALALAMSGYTINNSTLFRGLHQLCPGEVAIFQPDQSPQVQRYFVYRPWRADKPVYDPDQARKKLADTILALIDDMMKSIGDRQLVVPLSAGCDSRLIVSAARHLGYENVRTFAYGRKGNHEASASRAIAEKLGYDWQFVPIDTGVMRRHFASEDWQRYLQFSDSLQSVPFVQDLPQIQMLKTRGYIADDAVIANGNSGDFISGDHIVSPMDKVSQNDNLDVRRDQITQTLYKKHFALWMGLQSDTHRRSITKALWDSIVCGGGEFGETANDYGLYEYAEFQDRQSKYVISGQRIYEFLGHEWRLPLWDGTLLDFFEEVPLAGKVGQKLYLETLEAEDWGGVWQGVPINRKTIKPDWIRPLRWIAKAAHAPLGRDAWHAFERCYFQYWMELGGQSTIRKYRDVMWDRRGARHGVAWLTETYLARHGLNFDGTPIGS